ncbi:MAG: ACP S-malonyltransferase [Candidatus Eremiobacteraeota bacterium]|nr:ACP S-malonyltransferase [Candidatus Eremiobacteraeota bacterium]
MNRPRIGVIFPGQGCQSIGMGIDVALHYPAAAQVFTLASAFLGYDLLELQAIGPEAKLRETQFSQPAIFTTNCALYAAVGELLRPVVSVGHSFAEFCSLTIANSLSLESALRLVSERGKAMQYAAEITPGRMSAIIGLNAQKIREIVARVSTRLGASVQLANFNSPAQLVISGDLHAVEEAGKALLEAGAKRVVPLNVSGAWHSSLMKPAVERFAAAVNKADFEVPQFAVISNVDARPYADTATIKSNLVRSITHEVLWHEAACEMLAYDLDLLVEFGATAVLSALVKRLPNAPPVFNVADGAAVATLQQRIGELALA